MGATVRRTIITVLATGLVAGSVGLTSSAVQASPVGGGILSPGQPVCFDSGASAGESVIMNVTPVDATGPGFGTVTVTGEDWQASSSVNFEAGVANPNLVIKQPGGDGRLCYTASVASHVIVDVLALADLGWRSATADGGADRVVDTRPAGVLTPGQPECFDSGAAAGESVIANVTPVNAWAAGFGTVTVTGEDWQASSNVNFVEGAANPNLVIKQPAADGRLCYTTDVWSDVIVDVVGYASFASSRPGAATGGADRAVDTRPEGLRDPGQPRCFDSGASAGESVIMNATPVEAFSPGFGTVTVTGEDWQASSNVNFVEGAANPNLVIKQPAADGRLCYTADQFSDVLIDVIAYAAFDSRPGAADGGAERVVDTRQGADTPGGLETRAVDVFVASQVVCEAHAAQFGNSPPDPARFVGVTAAGQLDATRVLVVDGTGMSFIVDFEYTSPAWPESEPPTIYGVDGPDSILPRDLSFGCPPELWVGSAAS